MPQVTLTINGRNHVVACAEGQEERLGQVGNYLDARVRELEQSVGNVGEGRLLVLTALLIADEALDMSERLSGAGGEAEEAGSGAGRSELDDLGEVLEHCARRIDSIAERLARG